MDSSKSTLDLTTKSWLENRSVDSVTLDAQNVPATGSTRVFVQNARDIDRENSVKMSAASISTWTKKQELVNCAMTTANNVEDLVPTTVSTAKLSKSSTMEFYPNTTVTPLSSIARPCAQLLSNTRSSLKPTTARQSRIAQERSHIRRASKPGFQWCWLEFSSSSQSFCAYSL